MLMATLVSVATLLFAACDLEDSFGFNIPSAGNAEVIQSSASLTCWYVEPVAGPLAPMRVDLSVNTVSRRVTVMVRNISRVSLGAADGTLRVRCASQNIMNEGRYRLPGPGELADSGFLVVGIYFSGSASYSVSVNEYRLDPTGREIHIIPWLDGPYGRAMRNLPPSPRM